MRQKILSMTLLAAFALSPSVVAHEGHHHDAMGTIEAIDAEQITLTVSEDETETFVLTEETSFVRGEEPASREEAAVGERAVVMYEKKDGANVAIEVKLPPKAE